MNRRKRPYLRYLFLLLVVFLPPAALSSQVRDYWMKAERKGVGFAYDHITVTKLPDGTSSTSNARLYR